MPTVETSIFIEDADIENVWSILIDFESYPYFMNDVLDVKYIEKYDWGFETEWKVLLNGSELTWSEKDLIIDKRKIVFNQIDGDLEKWEGYFEVNEMENGVAIIFLVFFDLGIPSLEEVLNPIGIKAITSNSLQMLNAIKSKTLIGPCLEQ